MARDSNGIPEGSAWADRLREWRGLLPGLALTAVVAWLGLRASEWVGKDLMGFSKSPISGIMVAIIFGIVLGNVLPLPTWLQPGIRFSLKKVLRLGIILLGIRLSITDVLTLGALGVPVVILAITGGLIFTQWLGRRLNLSARLSTLVAVGSSICGASAIVATGPAIEAEEEEITYAIANITVFGILAMFLYPYLANALLGSDPRLAGLFLGTSIHETAQVAGAGLIYSELFNAPEGLDAATVTKLVRNIFMALVIPLMAYRYSRQNASQRPAGSKVSVLKLFPIFIFGFIFLAVVRSIGDATLQSGDAYGLFDADTWKTITAGTKNWAGNFLAMAMAGVGLGTRISQLRGMGLKPFYVGLGAAAAVGILSLTGILVLRALQLN